MSLSSSSVSRTTPPVERCSQRSERAPAGDFAALLDLAPAPARAPLARAAERREAGSHQPAAHDDRPERADPASPRSCHARHAGQTPEAASNRDAAPCERSRGQGGAGSDADATSASPKAASATAAAATGVPTTATQGGAEGVALPADMIGTLVGADPLGAPVPAVAPSALPQPAAAAEPATLPSPALAFPPAGLALGSATPGAATATPADAAAADEAAPTEATNPRLPVAAGALPVAAVAADGEAPVVATPDTPAEGVTPDGDTASAIPAAVPEADTAPAERSSADAPAGPAGESFVPATGAGAGAMGARDGRTAPAAELSELPGAPAPESAGTPAPLPGAGRAPDGLPFGLQRSVPLERAPRAVAQLLHVASQSGVSHARIALRPVELGGIEIFLQVSPAGLAAQVIADSPEAARMLSQATEDLRRSLAGQNVELISIDVSTSAEQQRRDDLASSGFLADDRTPDGRLAPRRADGGPAPTNPTPEPTTPTVIELPDGLLVDVLA